MTLAKKAGARRVLLLNISVPAHCELMKPASEKLAEILAVTKFSIPSLPVINNVDVVEYQKVEQIRDGLRRQLFSPVRWHETIELMIKHNSMKIIECGPGKVLTSLTRRINKSITSTCIDSPATLQAALQKNHRN